MKKIAKSLVFIFIFCLLWNYTFKILWMSDKPITQFYEEPNDSLDVIYIGSSNVFSSFNTTLAFNEYGFATGMLAGASQPFELVKYLIKESEKYQKPAVYVIDLYKACANTATEGNIRNTTDAMKFSLNRFDAINAMLKYSDIVKDDSNTKSKDNALYYYFSFMLYHNRWKNLSYDDFSESRTFYKGYMLSSEAIEVNEQDNFVWQDDVQELPKDNLEILNNLLDYIDSSKVNVLFIVPNKVYMPSVNSQMNYAIKVIEDRGYEVINFNTLDDFRGDYATEFMDYNHYNVYGATKYTLYFGKYLKEHYNLPDHREDERYSSWYEVYERVKEKYKELTGNNFDDMLSKYKSKKSYFS